MLNSDSWDLLKYKFIEKMTRPSGNAEFIMIFGGSSVTAGHDSFYNESYPFVTERRMKDAFSAAGVSLIVQNIAQGANQCLPSEWCYNSMGGGWEPEPKELGKAIPADRSKALDGSGYDVHADFLSWEQSFNCGRVPAMFELMARNAGRQNAVLYFASSGSFPHNEKCAPSKVFVLIY